LDTNTRTNIYITRVAIGSPPDLTAFDDYKVSAYPFDSLHLTSPRTL